MNQRLSIKPGARKHSVSEKMKELAAQALASKIGYLRIDELPSSSIFTKVPSQNVKQGQSIRLTNALALVRGGTVHLKHSYHKYHIKELTVGAVFGELAMLGQTMLGTQAIAGDKGATISIMDSMSVQNWLKSGSVAMQLLRTIGSRLAKVEVETYRSQFQLADSKIAALLLELAGEGAVIEGLTQEDLGGRIGLYRETVTNILTALKNDGFIEISRKLITIRDKRALRELTEL